MSYSTRPPLRQARPRREGPNPAGVALLVGAAIVAVALLFAVNALVSSPGPTGSPGATATPTEGAQRTEEPTERPTETPAESLTAEPTPTGTAGGEPTVEPTAGPTPTPSPEPTPAPTPEPTPSGSVEPTPEPTPGPAAACTGSRDTKDFFEALAEQVPWDVYCADLPGGWFVKEGRYRLAGGGWVEVSYDGPDGALLTLKEGFFCAEGPSVCAPRESELGAANFGDRAGLLVSLGGGDLAVYVSPDTPPSWTAMGEGLDQVTFTDLVAALVKVEE